jgi:hypothetical protein
MSHGNRFDVTNNYPAKKKKIWKTEKVWWHGYPQLGTPNRNKKGEKR